MNALSTGLFIFFLSWNVFQNQTYTRLNLKAFSQQITAAEVQLIDVRTPEEFEAGHIPGAINIDILDRERFKAQADCLDKDQPIYLYCKMGGRSKRAAEELEQMGFAQLYDLRGGYLLWSSFQ